MRNMTNPVAIQLVEDINNTYESIKLLEEKLNALKYAKSILEFGNINSDNIEEAIRDHSKQLKEANAKYYELENSLKDLRNNCDHDWVYDGHDSHHDWYVCSKCGDDMRV